MSSLLGNYERPRRPFPIFSLSRDDLHWTLILCVVCFYVAVVIRASQADHIVEVRSAWKGCLVVFGTVLGFMFGGLSTAKICFGYNSDDSQSEYQNLEEATATATSQNQSKLPPIHPHASRQPSTQPAASLGNSHELGASNQPVKPPLRLDDSFSQQLDGIFSRTPAAPTLEPAAAGAPPLRPSQTSQFPGTYAPPVSAAAGEPPRSARSEISWSSRSDAGRAGTAGGALRALREDEIDCGLVIEAPGQEFDLGGAKYPRGTLRVAHMERDGVCERQGACVVGDVIFSIDGKPVTGMDVAKVRSMLRGRAGHSIVLGIYTAQSRDLISRHVVLAPSPSSLALSPRHLIGRP